MYGATVCLTLSGMAVAPLRPETVYLVGFQADQRGCYPDDGATSYRTTDGGKSWQPLPISAGDVTVDPYDPNVAYALGWGVYRSTDGGATWLLGAGTGTQYVSQLAIDPAATQTLYAAGSRGLLVSHDRGTIFQGVRGLPGGEAVGVALDDCARPATLLVAIAGAGIFSSADDGGSWSILGAGLPTESLYKARRRRRRRQRRTLRGPGARSGSATCRRS